MVCPFYLPIYSNIFIIAFDKQIRLVTIVLHKQDPCISNTGNKEFVLHELEIRNIFHLFQYGTKLPSPHLPSTFKRGSK